jgi:hypothetical protein
VPNEVRFQTKPEIALQQLREALADGVPPGVALIDPAYGNDSKLRAGGRQVRQASIGCIGLCIATHSTLIRMVCASASSS